MKKFISFVLILICSISFSQNDLVSEKVKIATVFQNYFALNREAIHLHLNKSSFINNESIWFKGYTINRNNTNPNGTTNVYIILYDENGTKINNQLVYANNGIFTGNILLNNNLSSGKYYIQAYTNWMNNFNEDESTIIQIDIINPNQGYKNYEKVNYETISIKITPEGGKFIKDMKNTIGIHVSDCQNNSIKNLIGKVINDKNEEIKTFSLNQFGYGKIELTPTKSNLKIVINTPNGPISKDFPKPEEIGFGLEINSYTFNNKTFFKIKSNIETIKTNNSLFLVINQDEKSIIENVVFNTELEKTLVIDNKNLFEGIINVRLIDKKFNQLAERMVYIPLKSTKDDFQVKNKTLKLINQNQGNISVTILPEKSKSNNSKTPIIVGLKVNPYLVNSLKNSNYYFTNINRQKEYELDLALLNQKETKYNWNYMKLNPPKQKYSFDIGLTLKGKVETGLIKNEKYKVKIYSLTNFISEITDVNDKGEFVFENLVFSDSTKVELLLMKLPKLDIIDSKIIANVIDVKKPFYKSLEFKKNMNCGPITEYLELDVPSLKSNFVQLNEIVLENKFQKEKLKHEYDYGNIFLRPFKINDTYRSLPLLTFIARNGFIVNQNIGVVTIIAKTSSMVNSSSMRSSESSVATNYTTSNRSAGPEIWVDDRIIISTDEIKFLGMDEIDEIFLNPNINPIGLNNNQGIIKIYLKKPHLRVKQKETQKLIIKNGFSKIEPYKELNYTSKLNSGFENFGLIDWKPNNIANEKGEIEMIINNSSKVTIEIEGVSSDGKIIQHNLILE
jgi:hypothetical protein